MRDKLNYFFDREADVLYFSKGKPSIHAISQEIGEDVIVRLDPTTKEVVGFTILNFLKRLRKKAKKVTVPLKAKFSLAKV